MAADAVPENQREPRYRRTETSRHFAVPMDVATPLVFTALAIAALTACGGATYGPTTSPAASGAASGAPAAPKIAGGAPEPRAPDPDLHRPPRRKLLDIDWAKVALTDDAAARAVWRRIAPTGADWDD